MNELVNLIVQKTKLPPAMAQTVVNIMISYLEKKLPAPIASQVTAFLNNDAEVKMAENVLGGLANMVEDQIEKKASKGKK